MNHIFDLTFGFKFIHPRTNIARAGVFFATVMGHKLEVKEHLRSICGIDNHGNEFVMSLADTL
jgi:hypothetical protein